MPVHRCPICKSRTVAAPDGRGNETQQCLKCDQIDPLRTVAAKWAESSLVAPK
jgi:hypothetical protein